MSDAPADPQAELLCSAIKTFHSQKRLAEDAVRQISFEQMRYQPDPESNSVAVIMKHLAGNMRSRWTDFLTTDGEKEWRHRDGEFIDEYDSREQVMADWESGWAVLFETLNGLSPSDLVVTVTMRGEKHSVCDAILRQVSHYGYHLGQIVTLCRTLAGEKWHTLSIPRGQSEQYTQRVRAAAEKESRS